MAKRETERGKRRQPESSPLPEFNPSPAVCAVALLLLSLLITAARLHTYDELFDMDITTYTVMANEMRLGRHLYSELWDHKPPGVYASYYLAQSVLGDGPLHVFVIGVSVAVITLLGVYFAASQGAGTLAGLMAATFWAVVSSDMHLQANQPNGEAFINACVIWAFALMVRMPFDRIALGRALSVGALIALASLYKNPAAVVAVLFAAHAVSAGFTRESIVQAVVVAAVVILAWVGVIAYFAATDRLAAFTGTVFGFNVMYAGSLTHNLAVGLQPRWLFHGVILQFWPLYLPAAIGMALSRDTVSARTHLLLLVFCLTTFLSIALPGHFFRHYYQLWLPFLCVAAAWGIAVVRRKTNRWLAPALAAVVVALLSLLQVHNFSLSPEQWSKLKYGDRFVLSKHAADIVSRLLRPDEKFFQWGHHIDLYYYADRRPVGGEFRVKHLLEGTRQDERTAKLLADLEAEPPELIIIVVEHQVPRGNAAARWILEHYTPLSAQPCEQAVASRYLFLARNGGRLAGQRLGRCLDASASPNWLVDTTSDAPARSP